MEQLNIFHSTAPSPCNVRLLKPIQNASDHNEALMTLGVTDESLNIQIIHANNVNIWSHPLVNTIKANVLHFSCNHLVVFHQ